MQKIILNIEALETLQRNNGWTELELSRQSGISRSQLWRAKLPPHDPRHSLGQEVINKILSTFPEKRFEDIFLVQVCQKEHSSKESSVNTA